LYSFRLSRFCLTTSSSGTFVLSLNSWLIFLFLLLLVLLAEVLPFFDAKVSLTKSRIYSCYFFIIKFIIINPIDVQLMFDHDITPITRIICDRNHIHLYRALWSYQIRNYSRVVA
jgi:hypothetical protein